MMDELIAALTILRQYGNPRSPFQCEHDTLYVCGIEPAGVSDADKARLDKLGFFVSGEFGEDSLQFVSFRYGSA